MADLGRWTGGTPTPGVPTESWASPSGLFSTQQRNDSSVYTYTNSLCRLTLPSTGLADGYLMIARVHMTMTHNNRHTQQGRFTQNSGTGNFLSSTTGSYERNNNNNENFVTTWAFIDNPSASATFDYEWKRDTGDGTVTGSVTDCSLEVIPFYYADIGMYASTSTSLLGGTTPNTLPLSSTVLEGTNITRSGNVITVTGDNKRYLVFGSNYTEGRSGRTQRWVGLEYDGTPDNAAKACIYHRDVGTDENGIAFSDIIETVTASRTIEQFVYRGDGVANNQGGADIDGSTPTVGTHSMVVIELNDSAEVIRSSNASAAAQDIDSVTPVDMSVANVVDFNDSASFTKVSATAINCEVAMDLLAGANISGAYDTVSSGVRYEGRAELTVNGTEDSDVKHGNFGRGAQSTTDTFGYSANPMGFVAVTVDQDIGVSHTRNGVDAGPVTAQAGWSGFWAINLDTLEDAGGPLTASGTPSIESPTASGVVNIIKKASGAATMTAVAAAGISGLAHDASGAPSLDEITASGVATTTAAPLDASGSPSIESPTASGVVTTIKRASGSPVTEEITASGVTRFAHDASGSPTAEIVTASGVARFAHDADGTPTVDVITASGVATNASGLKEASGTPALPELTASGVAARRIAGTPVYQTNFKTDTTLASETDSTAFDVTAGDTIVFFTTVYHVLTVRAQSVTDTAGNTYRLLGEGGGDATHRMQSWVAYDCAKQTDNVITVTWSAAPSFHHLFGGVWSGLGGAVIGYTDDTDVVIDYVDGSTSTYADAPAISCPGDAFLVGGAISWSAPIAMEPKDGASLVIEEGVGGNDTWIVVGQLFDGSGSYDISVGSVTTVDSGDYVPMHVAFHAIASADASGTPSIDEITASGVASLSGVVTASGTPSIDALTASGVASLSGNISASGAPSIDPLTTSGSVTQTYKPSGAPSIDELTASGVAGRTALLASGNPSIESPVAAGVANIIKTASGTPSIGEITADGAVNRPRVWLNTTAVLAGATEMTVTAWNEAGTSVTFDDPPGDPTGSLWLGVENTRTGEVGWIAVTVNSADPIASGTPSIDTIVASGVATKQSFKLASGTPQLVELTASGAARFAHDASGAPSIEGIVASGVVTKYKRANGSPSIEGLTAAGTAGFETGASGTPSIDTITASGVVRFAHEASGAPSVDLLTASGVARFAHDASGAITLEAVTANGVAGISGQASAFGSPSIAEITASGTVTQTYVVSGAPTIEVITASGTVIKGALSASGAPSIDAVTAAGIVNNFTGTEGLPTLEVITASGVAATGTTKPASGTPAIDQITASGAANITGQVAASGSPSIDEITASGVAAAIAPLTASGAPQIGPLVASGQASQGYRASGTPELVELTASGSVTRTLVAWSRDVTNFIGDSDAPIASYSPKGNATDKATPLAGFAETITLDNTAGNSYAYNPGPGPGDLDGIYGLVPCRISCYVEMDDGSEPEIGTTTGGGDFGFVANSAFSSPEGTIEKVNVSGNIWRCSISRTLTGGGNNYGVIKYSAMSSTPVHVTGLQVELLPTLTMGMSEYVETDGAAATVRATVIPEITASGRVIKGAFEAFGSPSTPEITASGTIAQTYKVGGTPSIDALTASGVADALTRITGSPSIAELTSSGYVNIIAGLIETPSVELIGVSYEVVLVGADYNVELIGVEYDTDLLPEDKRSVTLLSELDIIRL